jgi:P27 family predicted phage terminase small subunit
VIRGRKPRPVARGGDVPVVGDALPRCPPHLSPAAQREWRRLATPLHGIGVLTLADRAALAAYCQAWGRWVEAEEKLKETPPLLKTPSGYVQQSPWLTIANKQLELMARFMAELGLTPASRSRLSVPDGARPGVTTLRFVTVYEDAAGTVHETALPDPGRPAGDTETEVEDDHTITVEYDPRL